MIRINLLPVERKKKPKPLPTLILSTVLITIFVMAVLAYAFFYYSSSLKSAKMRFEANRLKIEELKKKIKEVDDFEKMNRSFEERNRIIEQLRKNQNIPVKVLDEVSRNIPNGVWISSMSSSGSVVNIEGYAFTNSDVVTYVDKLKQSKLFSDIYLQESRQADIERISLYQFRLTFNVRV